MKVKDIMHKGATAAAPNTSLHDVAKQMRDKDIGAILVKEGDHLVGIVTDRDIACRAVAGSGDISRLTVKDVMSKHVVSCTEDFDLSRAVELMESKKVRRLPVTDSKHGLVGMLSLGDISHKAAKDLSGELLKSVSAHHS
jgi:CBS domain-containing protein